MDVFVKLLGITADKLTTKLALGLGCRPFDIPMCAHSDQFLKSVLYICPTTQTYYYNHLINSYIHYYSK